MRILITGAAGFIGANLCREMATRPGVEKITGLDDLSTGDPANLSGTGADLVIGSVLDQDLVQDLTDGVDAVTTDLVPKIFASCQKLIVLPMVDSIRNPRLETISPEVAKNLGPYLSER